MLGDNITRLADGTLLLPVKQIEGDFHEVPYPAYVFRSTDGGTSASDIAEGTSPR